MKSSFSDEQRRRLRREAGKGVAFLAVLVLLMGWLSGAFISKVEPGGPLPRPNPPALSTQRVERKVYPLFIDQVGNLQAHTEAQVASRIMAQVQEILVRPGDQVTGSEQPGREPTVLARLDDRDIRARLRQAEAQITAVERAREATRAKLGAAKAQVTAAAANHSKVLADYRRYQDLFSHQAATGQQLDHARAQSQMTESQLLAARQEVKGAEAELERLQAQQEEAQAAAAEARVMLSYTVIQAPFSGQLLKKMVDVGDMASPGQPLFLIETSAYPELYAFVADSLLPHVRVGQQLNVYFDSQQRTVVGTVREIVPKSDPATRTVVVKVSLPAQPDLVNGLFARLQVPYGDYSTLVVPISAVREVGQLHLVDVIDAEGYPQRRFVTLGQRHEDRVEILSGVEEHQEVVVP